MSSGMAQQGPFAAGLAQVPGVAPFVLPAGAVHVTAPITGDGTAGSPLAAPSVVINTRQLLTSAPLSGGGDLSADRTLSLLLGSAFAVVGGVLAPNAIQITVGSAVTSVTFNGLAGDTDGGYDLDCYIVQPGATNPIYTLQPNAITANQGGQRTTVDSALAATQRSDLCLTFVSTSATAVRARCSFNSKSGVIRKFIGFAAWKAVNENFEANFGEWTDTATVITSLKINCSVALGIGAGSVFTLTPMNKAGL